MNNKQIEVVVYSYVPRQGIRRTKRGYISKQLMVERYEYEEGKIPTMATTYIKRFCHAPCCSVHWQGESKE